MSELSEQKHNEYEKRERLQNENTQLRVRSVSCIRKARCKCTKNGDAFSLHHDRSLSPKNRKLCQGASNHCWQSQLRRDAVNVIAKQNPKRAHVSSTDIHPVKHNNLQNIHKELDDGGEEEEGRRGRKEENCRGHTQNEQDNAFMCPAGCIMYTRIASTYTTRKAHGHVDPHPRVLDPCKTNTRPINSTWQLPNGQVGQQHQLRSKINTCSWTLSCKQCGARTPSATATLRNSNIPNERTHTPGHVDCVSSVQHRPHLATDTGRDDDTSTLHQQIRLSVQPRSRLAIEAQALASVPQYAACKNGERCL